MSLFQLADPELYAEAPCVEMDPDAFYQRDGERREAFIAYSERARNACFECPVRQKCLDEAMKEEGALPEVMRYGLRGGLYPWERARIARSERRKSRRTRTPEPPTPELQDGQERIETRGGARGRSQIERVR